MNKAVAHVWTFKSSSNPDKKYETLLYTDGSTSCNCPGWTRKVDAQGNRSCKHTRSVHQGTANDEAVASHDYQSGPVAKPQTALQAEKTTKAASASTKAAKLGTARKIVW